MWVPSYIGPKGNETADQLANEATRRNQVDYQIDWELAEAYSHINKLIDKGSKIMWDNEPTGQHYKQKSHSPHHIGKSSLQG